MRVSCAAERMVRAGGLVREAVCEAVSSAAAAVIVELSQDKLLRYRGVDLTKNTAQESKHQGPSKRQIQTNETQSRAWLGLRLELVRGSLPACGTVIPIQRHRMRR